ncbi:MAG: 7-carboxy-7-deazaguanine synthase QueE [Myxococcales bacterium]|nr:7-carboxy-7-deazaguanine synthase QueE [Myxococcales bacterium]|tara:strand:- start:865 stop:1578 length:714 start_codon:yes stop_codon:yes gene_type:complete
MPLPTHLLEQTAAERIAPLKVLDGDDRLLVHEIYTSIQGESTHAGKPCVFIRLTGCHLRCVYCDTEHAFKDGEKTTLEEVLSQVRAQQIPMVELTGGEPLLQKGAFKLLQNLCDEGYTVLLETSGATSIEKVDRRVKVILDVKTPGSGEVHRNLNKNIDLLWPGCELKFVLCDRADFEWACQWLEQHDIPDYIPVLFSPEAEQLPPVRLAEWITAQRLPVQFQVQLHKILWGDERRR